MRALLYCILVLISLTGFADPDPAIRFIENKNQWSSHVDFAARVQGGTMMIHNGGFTYYFLDRKKIKSLHELTHTGAFVEPDESGNILIDGQVIAVQFVGANRSAVPQKISRSSEYYNFFLGNDRSRWAAGAFAYDAFLYPALYEGIDLKVYSSGPHVKYDFIVAPGGDPAQVKLMYDGVDKIFLENGNVYAKTSLVDIIEKRPYAYQWINGKKQVIACEFQLREQTLQFVFPEGYDPCYELVIDPLLIFSTYSGSTADNWGSTATPGEDGHLYSAGVTDLGWGGTFPATAGAFQTTYGGVYDMAILKYDSAGSQLLYASYLGGSDSESPHSLVVNEAEQLIVLGTSSSADFPTTQNAFQRTFSGGTDITHVVQYTQGSDIVVSRISKDGTQLLASTYIGGTSNDGLNDNTSPLNKNYGDQLRGDVICDDEGNIYISTVTASPDFPIGDTYRGGASDGLLIKFDPALSAVAWARFIGGSGIDAAHTIKLDKDKNILLAGGTTSTDFPVSTGAFQTTFSGEVDGWIAKVKNDGTEILQATYTGARSFDQVYFLDLNKQEEVYVYGQTDGNFAVSDPTLYHTANSGQFLQKFSPDLAEQRFYTVWGSGKGSPDISPTAFLVNDCNYIYMAGWGGSLNRTFNGWATSTLNLTTTNDALQETTSGNDFYFIVLAEDAKDRLYATFLGGTLSRTHVDGGTSRFDKSGIVYHAVCAGCSSGTPNGQAASDFPTTPGAWSRVNRSVNCNNAAFKFDLSSLRAQLRTDKDKICMPDKVVFENLSLGGVTFTWDMGDGTIITETTTALVEHEYKAPGTYKVWLKVTDPSNCRTKDSTSVTLQVFESKAVVQDDETVCAGITVELNASGAAQYSWRSEDGSFQSAEASPQANPADTTVYYLTYTENSGCVRQDTVIINAIPYIVPELDVQRQGDCTSIPAVTVKNLSQDLLPGDQLFFDFGDGTTADTTEQFHRFETEGEYRIKLVATREFCVSEKGVDIALYPLKVPNIITPLIQDGKNDTFTIQLGESGATPGDHGLRTNLQVYNRWGNPVYSSADYQNDWMGQSVAQGVYYFNLKVENYSACKGWVQLIK